ncbi:MAG: LemA family protein [Bacilli bacterium]|jgi:LemA protein|nr:LemA family protein [Bacilli bacterium]
MANELDELNGPVLQEGKDVNVIAKQIPVTVGTGSKVFEVVLWILPLPIISGLIWLYKKRKAADYLAKLQQKIQHDASQIDNYLEQRVMILQNAAKLLDKAVALDKETFVEVAKARGNGDLNGQAAEIENINKAINVAIEAYPDLKAHGEIADAMQQNSYLQKEITAAREQYNDTVAQWNREIQEWPTKRIVAAKMGYTTRVPFITSSEIKAAARGTFF